MIKRRRNEKPPWSDPRKRGRQKIVRLLIHSFAWIGIAMLYYVAFSLFFDTPTEYRMKRSTAKLNNQYKVLTARYDTLMEVLGNVVERDRNVFRILFEAEPYDFDAEAERERWRIYENLLLDSNRELGQELKKRTVRLDKIMNEVVVSYDNIIAKSKVLDKKIDYIPSIQPVVNRELTLLTASFGLRIQPFYKTLTPHMGVDYTVPEGTRIFATADGRIKDIISKRTTSGLTVIISHDGVYETTYSHLNRINVTRNQQVKRGDIIAWSGDTGMSLAPHLHYEVRHKGLRVDPIHYFFMELTPSEYRKLMNIARSGMQSFD